jgi:peptidoglycan/LPS O-acetylase OafA/YrhL
MHNVGGVLLDLVFVGAVAFACTRTRTRSWYAKWLRFPALRSIGKYSYGMYMWHVIVLGALPSWLILQGVRPVVQSLVTVLYGAGLTYLLALVSWNVWEKWFLRLKEILPISREVGSAGAGAP